MKFNLTPPLAILGFGDEGKAALEFVKRQGISDITICDQKDNPDIPAEVKKKVGPKAFEHLTEFKTIIRSPGVYYKLPGILEAKDQGINITSMTEMALEVGRKRMTAITGSNGKTTTTGMIDAILTKHYQGNIVVGGNDRQPVLQRALDHPTWPILMEGSSFQFADLKMSPHISGILNISPNHLDWHENLEDYITAKANLIAHQDKDDWCILNANDENSAKLAHTAESKIFWVGKKEGDHWAMWENISEGDIGQCRLDVNFNGNLTTILHTKDLKCKTHPDNLAFAVAVAMIHNVDPTLIKDVLSEFPGMPQRLEFVREINGIKFYNDSSCTTPESTWVAMNQFPQGELILMLGGSTKHSDFTEMAKQIVHTQTRVYLYGAEGPRIQNAIEVAGGQALILEVNETGDFKIILDRVFSLAKPGDNIVLSPACASFDMFKNSKERGRLFSEMVNQINSH